MDQIFSTTNLTVNQLIEKIDTGELGLPELQRPFVWKDSQIRDLLDSMLHGYPVGYIMLWDCPELEKKKSIGTDEKSYSEPKEAIIDGQQRLTSLYAVIKGRKVIDSRYNERDVIISFNPLTGKFEVGNAATNKSSEYIYDISTLFAKSNAHSFINRFMNTLTEAREKNGEVLTDEESELISENIEAVFNLKKYIFPVFKIKAHADEEAVSQIFVRINSQGVKLTEDNFILTLLSVHWEDGRREIERFCSDSLSPLLRGSDFEHKGMVNAELMQKNFSVLKEKLPDVLDVNNLHEFFKAVMNAGYLYDSMILSKNAVFHIYAMYLTAKYRFHVPSDVNRNISSLWFFYAELIQLYSRNDTNAEAILSAMKNFTSLEEYRNFIISRIEQKFTDDYFSITLPGSEGLAVSGSGNNAWYAYVASLNILGRKVLFSRGSLTVQSLFMPGSDGTRKSLEKHHLFPKAYLKTQGYTDTQINQMANYAYIDWDDNMKILEKSPSEYYPVICEGMTREDVIRMEEENALPRGWENMSYDEFLIERRKLMSAIIKQAYETLKSRI